MIKLKLSKEKGNERAVIKGGLFSKVSGKILLRTPFGNREILPNGKLKKIK